MPTKPRRQRTATTPAGQRITQPGQRKNGRPSEPYRTSWDECINGLYRKGTSNVWRVTATRFEFRESDERAAVARFRAMQRAADPGRADLQLNVADVRPGDVAHALFHHLATYRDGRMREDDLAAFNAAIANASPANYVSTFMAALPHVQPTVNFDDAAFCEAVRRWILDDPAEAARRLGIPDIARLSSLPEPTPAPRLDAIMDTYRGKRVAAATIRKTAAAFGLLKEHARAEGGPPIATTADLDDDAVERFADWLNNAAGYEAGTQAVILNRLRAAVSHARKPKSQRKCPHLRELHEQLKALSPSEPPAKFKSDPVPVKVFRDLLETAAGPKVPGMVPERETALLLLSLNACMKLGEVLAVQWHELDLDAGLYIARRTKTAKRADASDAPPRVAVLWPRTIAALKAYKAARNSGSPYVFVSSHGTPYGAESYRSRVWPELRTAAGHPKIKHEQLRDAAYTVAAEAEGNADGGRLDFARVLAGHRTPGMTDGYIQRHPRIVARSCAAIEAAYFPNG